MFDRVQQAYNKKVDSVKGIDSWAAFRRAIETDETAHGRTEDRTIWKNEDLDLTPPKGWTWGWYDYAAFWWSYGFSTGVWSVGSSMVALGLNSWQALICVFISHTLGAIAISLHSRAGAKWHFGFPVECRVSWGMYASFFPIVVRLLVGLIWNAVQCLQGGFFTSILLRCIFGYKWHNIPATFPASADITLQRLVGMILFVFISSPLLALPPGKMRRLFTIKSIVLPPVVIGLFAFCIVKGKEAGFNPGNFTASKQMSGSTLGWVMLSAINSCMGKTSTQAVNQTDLSRYARTAQAPFWSQLIALPLGNTLCAALGIFATSATQQAWGVTLWNPWDLSSEILDRYWSAGTRTCIALLSMGFMFSIYASNLGVNLFPFGADVTAVFPRYLNIRRGMYLCYFTSFLLFPWKILKSSTTFLRFLGGYSIFLAPLCGVFITDYYVVRKGNIWAKDLFTPVPGSAYWYHYGASWRCIVSFIVTVVILVPGFAGQFGHDIAEGWLHIYSLGWVLGCTISSVLYWSLCQIGDFAKQERRMGWEEAYEQQAMFANPGAADDAEFSHGAVVEGQPMEESKVSPTMVAETKQSS